MRRFIITGAPGSGKTAIIRQLELDGFSIVEEAATDVIAAAQAQGTVQPWTHPSFIDVIANLQRDRQIRASYQPDEVQFHDRCAVCTAALAVYLGHPFSPFLASELQRLQKEAIYQNRVLWLANCCFAHISLGFPFLLRFCDEQSGYSFYPFPCYPGTLARSWRRPFHNCGVPYPQALTLDRGSLTATIAECMHLGPHPRRLNGTLGTSHSSAPFRNCTEALDTASDRVARPHCWGLATRFRIHKCS